jgi:IS5 family transposase
MRMVCRSGLLLHQGTTADCAQSVALIDGFEAEYLLADRGYDSDAIVDQAKLREMTPVIPPKKNRRVRRDYDKGLYKARPWWRMPFFT